MKELLEFSRNLEDTNPEKSAYWHLTNLKSKIKDLDKQHIYVKKSVEDKEISLRDYFAAKAMQGLISDGNFNLNKIIEDSYIVADVMLIERDK